MDCHELFLGSPSVDAQFPIQFLTWSHFFVDAQFQISETQGQENELMFHAFVVLPAYLKKSIWRVPYMEVSPNGWFLDVSSGKSRKIHENPIQMDDFGVPKLMESSPDWDLQFGPGISYRPGKGELATDIAKSSWNMLK